MVNLLTILIGFLVLLAGIVGLLEIANRLIFLLKHPRAYINNLRVEDQVCIKGLISDEIHLIKSPLTNSDCAFWQIIIKSQGMNSELFAYKKIKSQTPLKIDDDTGIIKIILAHSQIELCRQVHFWDHQNMVKSFANSNTIKFLNEMLPRRKNNSNLTVSEYIIKPQDQLFIWGKLIEKDGDKVILAEKISDSLFYQISGIIIGAIISYFVIFIAFSMIYFGINQ
jgi:hypothetical protein